MRLLSMVSSCEKGLGVTLVAPSGRRNCGKPLPRAVGPRQRGHSDSANPARLRLQSSRSRWPQLEAWQARAESILTSSQASLPTLRIGHYMHGYRALLAVVTCTAQRRLGSRPGCQLFIIAERGRHARFTFGCLEIGERNICRCRTCENESFQGEAS